PVVHRADDRVLDQNGVPQFNGTGLPQTDEYGRPLVVYQARNSSNQLLYLDASKNETTTVTDIRVIVNKGERNSVPVGNTIVNKVTVPTGGQTPGDDNHTKPHHVTIYGGQATNAFGDHSNDNDTFTVSNNADVLSIVRQGVTNFTIVDAVQSAGDQLTIKG